ncbi:hypothetical protein QJS10_CPB17g01041 [Acorus calamus]|uniref:Uncharacterized protein n=1 Tax=Acorus calamus TaxID=4465 RepID=A0AAV9CYA4_ACOCL|nr:hypothetical protein QJS10_CPB17g01041 [Acorus calamus]
MWREIYRGLLGGESKTCGVTSRISVDRVFVEGFLGRQFSLEGFQAAMAPVEGL